MQYFIITVLIKIVGYIVERYTWHLIEECKLYKVYELLEEIKLGRNK
jgi:hypothetical protein